MDDGNGAAAVNLAAHLKILLSINVPQELSSGGRSESRHQVGVGPPQANGDLCGVTQPAGHSPGRGQFKKPLQEHSRSQRILQGEAAVISSAHDAHVGTERKGLPQSLLGASASVEKAAHE